MQSTQKVTAARVYIILQGGVYLEENFISFKQLSCEHIRHIKAIQNTSLAETSTSTSVHTTSCSC